MRELMLVFHKTGELYFSVDTSAQGGDAVYWQHEADLWKQWGFKVLLLRIDPAALDQGYPIVIAKS